MTDDHDRILDCMTRMTGDNQPFALATVVRTRDATSAKAGAKAVIRADSSIEGWIGGNCTRGAVVKAATQALADGRPRLIRVGPAGETDELDDIESHRSHCPSGGTTDVFIEPVLPRPALLVLGASPTGMALLAVGKAAGFAVTVAAPADAAEAIAGADWRIEGYDLSAAPRAAESFIVVATQGRRDREALEAALGTGAGYVAFVGSRRKAGKLKDDLAAAGVAAERIAAIRAPAGLDIGAATPGEIALSVLADIVRERRQGARPEPRVSEPARSAKKRGAESGPGCH
ncbi:MAG: XdhC family protein [Inquilinus sp.]|nr:XdhC family protein [Inquilinus sp.]